MTRLVLSLFPGLALLDAAFEEQGWCVVQAKDRLMGGDHRAFHAVPGRFDGVIGGPPCKAFSRLRFMILQNGYELAPNLIPEYCRIVREAAPRWFLMENVPEAPLPVVDGYQVRDTLLRDSWVGGDTQRLRRFSFGTADGLPLRVEQLALCRPDPEHSTMAAGGGRPVPVALGPNGKRKKSALKNYGYSNAENVMTGLRHAGLQADFFEQIEADVRHHPWTVAGKQSLVGNAVPMTMGRAIAKAVKAALEAHHDDA